MSCSERIIEYLHNVFGKKGLRILFMPYKKDMWDALEPVYLEALKADEPYIYPLPYYTKADLKRHRDIDYEYPIIDEMSQEYDVCIYHYPYGDLNKITGITSYYQARNINNMLKVYIPYFVVGDYIDRSFVLQEGVVFSDITICESAIQRQQYLRILNEFGIEPKMQLLPFGNPKYDAVKNYVLDPNNIPESWKSKTKDKEVVLVNTGLMPLLNGKHDKIQQTRKVLGELLSVQEYCVLWRPHPLIESGIDSLCPQLRKEWDELKNYFMSEDKGIFDNTNDFQRAIALSDRCYSDPSSLIHLYKVTGKVLVRM